MQMSYCSANQPGMALAIYIGKALAKKEGACYGESEGYSLGPGCYGERHS